MIGPRRFAAALAALAALAACLPATAAAAVPRLETGLFDETFTALDPATRGLWLDRAASTAVQRVRLVADWSVIVPERPAAGSDPADPANPAYRWEFLDGGVQDAVARRLAPLLVVAKAPAWAEGPSRPAQAPPGSWRPDPAALEAFATALATRYSGAYAPPGAAALPRVRDWQAWNEPNLARNVSPQWEDGRPASPALFRRLVNAVEAGVRRVDARAVVVTGATAPFGDREPGGSRIKPVRFASEFLCVEPARAPGCDEPARFDVLAHNAYGVAGPAVAALDPQDVSVNGVRRLTTLLRQARRANAIRGGRTLWITEVGWDTKPPDPTGVPLGTQARWLSETLYLLWRQGARAVFWINAGDKAPAPDFGATQQSGVHFLDGRAKPSAKTLGFPLVADRLGKRRIRLWTRAPRRGRLVIAVRQGRWRPVLSKPVRAGQVVQAVVRGRDSGRFRATVGGSASPAYRARRLKVEVK